MECYTFSPEECINRNIQILHENSDIQSESKEEAKNFCKSSKTGCHKCSVKTRFGFCCDLCLEEELLWLRNLGVHTVASCCGHGDKDLASIVVVTENSAKKMEELGYKKHRIHEIYDRTTNWVPKSIMIYE